jgi:DinB family protein
MQSTMSVYLEITEKRVFAGAIEWPGFCRSGRTEDAALEALATYGARYANVARRAGPGFRAPNAVPDFTVAERLKGDATTEFGAPSQSPSGDRRDLDQGELTKQLRILEASWASFDDAVVAAAGVELRTGPRGGGRSRDKIVQHLIDAERAYLLKLGARPPASAEDAPAAIEPLRHAVREALTARALGQPLPNPSNPRTVWTPRYFLRRAAWHVLDHAWELEDRTPSRG